MANGLYLRGQYYLIPEEFQNFDDYYTCLQRLTFPIKQKLVWLQENHRIPRTSVFKGESIAPYFLSGYHDAPVEITISCLDDLIPVDVYVMDQDTYNARLRELINSYCPGCKRFKPLTNRVQSLNGHHEEISLDGVCFFRYETNPSPRCFHFYLFWFGGFFEKFQYEALDVTAMRERLTNMYLRYASAELCEEDSGRVLELVCKKNEILTPILTQFVGRYIESVIDPNYHIRLKDPFRVTEEYIEQMLSDAKIEAFRKECKKYGVSILILQYEPGHQEAVTQCLSDLTDHYYLEPLLIRDGRHIYLATETPVVLKCLHYHTPLLERLNTFAEVYDQYKNTRYRVCFDMPSETI